MIPVVALVGRPNVGKSTLFNRLTKTQNALVADMPGVTRDRQYGDGKLGDKPYIVVDTGGIGEQDNAIDEAMAGQSEQAIEEADLIFFLVEATVGMTPVDAEIIRKLRRLHKPVYLVVNKVDGLDPASVIPEFAGEGFPTHLIAAAHNRGIRPLIDEALAEYPEPEVNEDEENPGAIKVALVGRPNVGKSTLTNRFLNEDRVVVFDHPGTTRDSIYIDFERQGQAYTFIDTAGVRRKARVTQALEKFSIVKTLQAIKDAHVAVLLMDAQEGITEQDLKLIGFVLETGKALVVAINKWDGMASEDKKWIKDDLTVRLRFLPFSDVHFISALHGTGVGLLYDSINQAYQSATQPLSTARLTQLLLLATQKHPPPIVNRHRIKLRYAHCGGHNPPIVVIHGNQTDELPGSYVRYLESYFRDALALRGTPIKIQTKTTKNPYEGRRNTLTPRQMNKRKRFMKFVKQTKKRAKKDK